MKTKNSKYLRAVLAVSEALGLSIGASQLSMILKSEA